MHCLGAIWKWEEWRSLFLFSARPGMWTSSVLHIQISWKGEQSLWQRCSSLLSWKSKTGGQASRGVALALLLGVSRQFWGKHPWLVCVWSVGGRRVRGAVGSFCAECGCSTPCWAVQRSLEVFSQLCWILEKKMDVPRYCILLKWRISKQLEKRFFLGCFKSELLCAKATREPKAGNIGCGFGKHSTKQALKLDFRSYRKRKSNLLLRQMVIGEGESVLN